MTPYTFAKAECANMDSDGTCLMIEPSSLHDYSLPLPEGLSEESWQALVAKAREEERDTIQADIRTGGRLDMTEPHANRHRLDMYFCPGCGQRMGNKHERRMVNGVETAKVCLSCAGVPIVPDDVDQRCKLARGKRCGYFENCILPLADDDPPKDEPRLQAKRDVARRAYAKTHNFVGADEPGRACPDCGGPLPKRHRFCPSCARIRRRASYRGARNS